jgi:hypothetical protein
MHCRECGANIVLGNVLNIGISKWSKTYAIGDDRDFELANFVTIPTRILFAAERSRSCVTSLPATDDNAPAAVTAAAPVKALRRVIWLMSFLPGV